MLFGDLVLLERVLSHLHADVVNSNSSVDWQVAISVVRRRCVLQLWGLASCWAGGRAPLVTRGWKRARQIQHSPRSPPFIQNNGVFLLIKLVTESRSEMLFNTSSMCWASHTVCESTTCRESTAVLRHFHGIACLMRRLKKDGQWVRPVIYSGLVSKWSVRNATASIWCN